MRQELLAGLIVVTFGLPVAIIADGKELARELTAIELAVKGNPAPLKQIWVGQPKAEALPAPHVDELDAILASGARALAEAKTARRPVHHSVASPVMIPEPPRMSNDDVFVLAGTDLQFVSRQLRDLGTVAIEVATPQVSASAEWPTMDEPHTATIAAAVADEFSLAAQAEPAVRAPDAAHMAATDVHGPWIHQDAATLDDSAATDEASTDGVAVDVTTAGDTAGADKSSDSFQQIGVIDGGFTSAVPPTSASGLTDIITATR